MPDHMAIGERVDLFQHTVRNDLLGDRGLHVELHGGLIAGMVLGRQPEMRSVGPVIRKDGAVTILVSTDNEAVANIAVVSHPGHYTVAGLLLMRDFDLAGGTGVERTGEPGV